MDNVFQYILQLQNYQPMLTILTVLAAFLVGLYVFFIYRITFAGVIYSRTFNLSLVMLCMVTATVIMFMANNVKLSLGMVGALSIVRFRTAVKDPLDLIFLFWAIAVGVICGTGMAVIAVALTLVLSLLLWIFNALPIAKAPVLLLVSSSDLNAEAKVLETAGKHARAAAVKSRSLTPERLDLIVELRAADEAALTAAVLALPGTLSCSVVAHDGEVTF